MRIQVLLPLLAAAATAQDTCNWDNDDTCRSQINGVCDEGFDESCNGGDCYDCDLMQQFRYNCTGCVEAGGFWCPGDALCLSRPQPEDYFSSHFNHKGNSIINACPNEADWKQSCEPLSEENVFTDPLYDAMAWEFKLINVEEVWRLGFTGRGVHVRVTDDGKGIMICTVAVVSM